MFYLLGIQFTERIQHNLKNVLFHERPVANWFWNQHISADNAVLFFAIRRNQAQLSAGKVNMQEFSSDEASSKIVWIGSFSAYSKALMSPTQVGQ